jgi:hypothetical protein
MTTVIILNGKQHEKIWEAGRFESKAKCEEVKQGNINHVLNNYDNTYIGGTCKRIER